MTFSGLKLYWPWLISRTFDLTKHLKAISAQLRYKTRSYQTSNTSASLAPIYIYSCIKKNKVENQQSEKLVLSKRNWSNLTTTPSTGFTLKTKTKLFGSRICGFLRIFLLKQQLFSQTSKRSQRLTECKYQMSKGLLTKTAPPKRKKANWKDFSKSQVKLEWVGTQIRFPKRKSSPGELHCRNKPRTKQEEQLNRLQRQEMTTSSTHLSYN